MTHLSFNGITKSYGGVTAVDNVSLDISSGEFLSLVGASGCGKTTLLRIIAGFTKPDAGVLFIDGKQVESLPPNMREVGFVFQSYALFPTQTVAQNIGFSLSIRHRPKTEIIERVRELCELVHLSDLEDRYPHQLSGGQQQRVALARALALSPSILLLDEPLAALDAKIRTHLRAEIRTIVDRLGITAVYVTHDQEEALSISDRVAVMNSGRFMQVGTPMEVYLKPAGPYVAEFIGTANMLLGRPAGDGFLEIEGQPVEVPIPEALAGQDVYNVSVRPEHVHLVPASSKRRGASHPDFCSTVLSGKLVSHSFLGQSIRTKVITASGKNLVVDMSAVDWLALGLSEGDDVSWSIRSGAAVVFPYENDTSPSAPCADEILPEREA